MAKKNKADNAEPLIWETVKRKVKDLKTFDKNPRRIKDKNFQELEKSLTKFNYVDLIIIDTDNMIVGGHQRYKILSKDPEQEVEVRIPNRKLSTEDFMELNLRLNLNQGEFDFGALQSRANWDVDMLLDAGFEKYQIAVHNAEIENDRTIVRSVNVEEPAYNSGNMPDLEEGQTAHVPDEPLEAPQEPMVLFEMQIPKSRRDALNKKINDVKLAHGFEFMFEAFLHIVNV